MLDLCLGNATKGNLDLNLTSHKKSHECPLLVTNENCRPCSALPCCFSFLYIIEIFGLSLSLSPPPWSVIFSVI